ncbi:MAG: DUF2752 domain-containing protein [Armatimonadota bacterium]
MSTSTHQQMDASTAWAKRRTDNLILFAVATVVIAVSIVLTPHASGYGTHQELLMPPCIFRMVTHVPCPMCGMTTSFAMVAEGDLAGAFDSHILGPPMFVLTVMTALLGLFGALVRLPDWLDPARFVQHSRWAWVIVVAMLLAWPINIVLYFTV